MGHSPSPRVRLQVSKTESGWLLHSPSLQLRDAVLSGHCRHELVLESTRRAGQPLESNAGLLFEDRDLCREAPKIFRLECINGDCDYQDPLIRPFLLSECEAVFDGLHSAARRIHYTSHDAALRTVVEFDELLTREGILWERRDADSCGRVDVRTTEEARTRLIREFATDDRGTITHQSVYEFQPLFRRAYFHSYGVEGPEGPGEWGSIGPRKVALYVAEGAFFLEEQPPGLERESKDRFLYLEREHCQQSGP